MTEGTFEVTLDQLVLAFRGLNGYNSIANGTVGDGSIQFWYSAVY